MDDVEKMLLEDIQNDMREMREESRTINKNILYLCRHSACTENRLLAIETNLKDNNSKVDIFQKRISIIEGKLIAYWNINSYENNNGIKFIEVY